MAIGKQINTQGKRVRGAPRTSRDDWVNAALGVLVAQGVEAVKISTLSTRLNCARSSFYWYFKNRGDLLAALLDYWQDRNTKVILEQANAPATSINFALANLFACWVSDISESTKLFDTRLDFAVRAWARRDRAVRRAVDISDDARLQAIKGMFMRFGYGDDEASIRARVIYFTQIGYEALEVRDSKLERARTAQNYLYCLTGVVPSDEEIAAVIRLNGHRLEDLDG